MAALSSAILSLRRDGRLLKLPPYLSLICILVGMVWLLLLPLNEYSRHTYVSENALLPGQVHTYFGGSEHNIFRAYRHEVAALAEVEEDERIQRLGDTLKSAGLKVATQSYQYASAGDTISGKNVYAILQGPRADATEAIVLVGAWRNMAGELNQSGVALVLTLARYFKRWSLWSKDIIFVITGDSTAGPSAWVSAYHDAHDPSLVSSLPIKSGALQGACAVDYPAGPWGHRFDKLHIVYDGINGQLPNLDLFNTAVNIATGQMGIGVTLQRMWTHDDSYRERLQTILRGMMNQGLGHASGPHSAFIPYHVDAITLQTVGDGWHDEMSLGRTVESLFRSLNNLLEHLHQSFFFYLLMQANRFVSIGTYLPSAMLIAVNFTIMSIALWVKSGRAPRQTAKVASTEKPGTKGDAKSKEKQPDMVVVKEGKDVALVPQADLAIVERKMFLPLAFVGSAHFLGLAPLYIFNHSSKESLPTLFHTFTILSVLLPHLTAIALTHISPTHRPAKQELALIQCFSILLLGIALATLSTLNFSQGLAVGLFCAPLSFVRPLLPSSSSAEKDPKPSVASRLLCAGQALVLAALSPPILFQGACAYLGVDAMYILREASFAWHVWGLWTAVVVWLVWWPAWFAVSSVVAVGVWW